MNPSGEGLRAEQVTALQSVFQQGAVEASRALSKWLEKESVVEVHSLEQQPLEAAVGLLGSSESPLLFGVVQLTGYVTGHMMLAFDEASGRALVEMLVDGPVAAEEWNELAESAVLETTNIVCCAYLNALADRFSSLGEDVEILPTPPVFRQEFAESLLEFALMDQAIAADTALVAQTRFEVEATPLNWTLLFLPDAESLLKLPRLLSSGAGPA